MTLSTNASFDQVRRVCLEQKQGGGSVDEWVSSLSEADLNMILPVLKYVKDFGCDMAEALRGRLIRSKREYDVSGSESKTPFALRNIQDPFERRVLLYSTFMWATTHGCRGCHYCGLDAYPVTPSNIEVTPLGQKKHLIDELAKIANAVYSDNEKIKRMIERIHVYGDGDPLYDPDIAEVLSYFDEKTGASLFLSTSLPSGSRKVFESIAKKAYLRRKLQIVEAILEKMPEFSRYGSSREFLGAALKDFPSLINFGVKYLIDNANADDGISFDAMDRKVVIGITKEVSFSCAPDGVFLQLIAVKSRLSKMVDGSPMTRVRVSCKNSRDRSYLKSLRSRGGFYFSSVEINDGYIWDVGKPFYDASTESPDGLRGILNISGMTVGPFCVFGSVQGTVPTRDHPQGRIVVPYEGFVVENPLVEKGIPLAEVLRHVVVLPVRGGYNGSINVVDGSRQKRVIRYDPVSYIVESDSLVDEFGSDADLLLSEA